MRPTQELEDNKLAYFFNQPMEAVRDSLWKHIYIPDPLYQLVKTPDFIRLSRIKQLGPASLVYPCATHTREAHSFGVYHLAMRLLEGLLPLGAKTWTTKQGCRSFAAAALCHDLGHFPFTHSLKDLPLLEHETLTAKMLLREPLNMLLTKWGADPEQSAAIIDKHIKTSDTETLFFRRLLSGVLDPDKLDYLTRDAFFCGVPYGTQDIDFIFSRLLPHKERGLVLMSSGISALENLLFSKYLMYRSVYWHRSVRIATAMMKKTLLAALQKNFIQKEELYSLDDESLYHLLESRYLSYGSAAFPEYLCAQELYCRKLYSLVLETPFNANIAEHQRLENLEYRTLAEHSLAKKLHLKTEEILIDIPERIFFESDLWIEDEQTEFSGSSTVFSEKTVQSFTSVLRKIRVGIKSGSGKYSTEQTHKIIAKNLKVNYTV